MVYFIILIIIIILIIPQLYYKKSNNLRQNERIDLKCDFIFNDCDDLSKIEDSENFGNFKDFYHLSNCKRLKVKSYDDFILDAGFSLLIIQGQLFKLFTVPWSTRKGIFLWLKT